MFGNEVLDTKPNWPFMKKRMHILHLTEIIWNEQIEFTHLEIYKFQNI